MAISIKVGDAAKAPSVKLELDIRRSMNGDLMVFDHGDIDIILSPSKNKVVAFPKDTMSDLVYGAQNRLFNFLTKKGLVLPESVHAGSFYGDSAELGEVPQRVSQGSISKGLVRDPYSLNYLYTI